MRRRTLETLLAKMAVAETFDDPCDCPVCAELALMEPDFVIEDEFEEMRFYNVNRGSEAPYK